MPRTDRSVLAATTVRDGLIISRHKRRRSWHLAESAKIHRLPRHQRAYPSAGLDDSREG